MRHSKLFLILLTAIFVFTAYNSYVFSGEEIASSDDDEYPSKPKWDKGVAYIQGHGGHIAVIDLVTGEIGRFTHGKPSDAITISEDGKTLYTFSLDGWSTEIDVETGKKTEWKRLGKKHCGSAITPDGKHIWVSDMTDGHVYVYDRKTKKKVDSFPVSKSICMITFTKDGSKAYVADMPGGFISIVDVKTKKVVGKITNAGVYIHRGRTTPNGKQIWVSDGSELDKGKPHGLGYTFYEPGEPGGVTVIDAKTNKVEHKMKIGGNPHGVTFSPDGKYALIPTRQFPYREESSIAIVDTDHYQIVDSIPMCDVCHSKIGFEVPHDKDGGRPFNCGMEVDWNRKGLPKGVQKF